MGYSSPGLYSDANGRGAVLGTLQTNDNAEANKATLRPNGSVVFGDGRHRYAFLRDQGLDKIPISMDADSIKYAKKFGYID